MPALSLTVLAGLICFSQSLLAGVVTIDFETFPDSTAIADSTSITNQFPGLTFTNTTVITAGISLNEFELPPYSGQNVAFDDGGPISISFDTPVLSFGGYFTYYEPLTIAAFDSSSNRVAAATSVFNINVACDPGPVCLGDPGSSPNEFLSVAFSSGISAVTITGDPGGGSFVLDDATYTSAASVPEPASLVLILSVATLFLATRMRAIYTTMKALLFVLAITIVGAIGAVWLRGAQRVSPPPSVPAAPSRSTTSTRAEGALLVSPSNPSAPKSVVPPHLVSGALFATSSTAHVIDWVDVTPLTLVAGASSPVVITAQITDPAVIRNSITLVYSPPSGPPQVIGVLNDAGINGDLTANDDVFTISTTTAFLGYQPGVLNLNVSAAFTGALQRTQVSASLTVLPKVPVQNGVPIDDSQQMFSLTFPENWGISATDSLGSLGERDVDFVFQDGSPLFTIHVYPLATWAAMQSGDAPLPIYLGQTSQLVFAYSDEQDAINGETIDSAAVAEALPQILSTFVVIQH